MKYRQQFMSVGSPWVSKWHKVINNITTGIVENVGVACFYKLDFLFLFMGGSWLKFDIKSDKK